MVLIKADITKKSPEEVSEKSLYIETNMTGNIHFPNPVPKIADLTAARTALDALIQDALPGAHTAIAARNTAAAFLKSLLVQEAQYVNSASGTDMDKALTSGFGPAKQRAPYGPLPAPTDFTTKFTNMAGRIVLECKRVKGARLYHFYMGQDASKPETFVLVGSSTRSRFEVNGLTTGGIYFFQVTAIGAAGESARSQFARGIAA